MAKKAPKKAKKSAAKKPAARKAAPRKASKPAARSAKAPAAPKWKMPGAQDLIPNLILKDAAGAIEFYKAAFGAVEIMRHPAPGGKGIWHAEIRIGDTVIAMNDEMPGAGPNLAVAATPSHKPTATFMIYSADCDAMFNRAVQAGAKVAMPLMDMFWGDRTGMVTDAYGQAWMLGTHKKDLTVDEMRKAGEEFAAQMAKQQQPTQPPPAAPPSKPPPPSGSQPPPPAAAAH